VKFLLDQDVYALTARFLVDLGHDVVLVSQLGLSQASDETILQTAQEQHRILITRDRDYGNLVFVKGLGSGVLYLRVLPSKIHAVHTELRRVIQNHSEQELRGVFVVIESNGYRLRMPLSQ
jgi:predicted nuclease of predicted toxin-antitoxin system